MISRKLVKIIKDDAEYLNLTSINDNNYFDILRLSKYTFNSTEVNDLKNDYVWKVLNAKFSVEYKSLTEANMKLFNKLFKVNDKLLNINYFSNSFDYHYQFINYNNNLIDYNEVLEICKQNEVKGILVGFNSYCRIIDFKKIFEISKLLNIYLIVDISLVVGLVSSDIYPSPIMNADFVITSLNSLVGLDKTLVLSNNQFNSHLVNNYTSLSTIQCLIDCLDNKNSYLLSVVNIQKLGLALREKGISLKTNGTDTNFLLIENMDIIEIKERLFNYKIKVDAVNNSIMLNAYNLTVKGLNSDDFYLLGDIIGDIILNVNLDNIKERINILKENIKL